MTCSFCQNYEISQHRPKTDTLSIDELSEALASVENNAGIAYTYNEPLNGMNTFMIRQKS